MTTPPPEPQLPVLGGRYRLVERIARGGMGEVWRGFDDVLSRPVAVKVLRPEYADEQVFLERFRNEARSTATLAHTGIAAVYDFGQAMLARTVVPFIVMELIPGEPLSHIIEREGALERDRALDLTAQAARALHAAHSAGVVHRDVKPANLLVTPSWVVKLTDFGIARAGDTLPLTRTGTVMGTAHYLAPELVSGRGVASPASDLYALGVVLYECLAGRRPFAGDNPLAVAMENLHSSVPDIPGLHPQVAELLAAVLAKDPAARPESAAAFAHQLLALRIDLAGGEPTPEVVARSMGEPAEAADRRAATRSRGGHRRHAAPATQPTEDACAIPDPRAVTLPTDLSAVQAVTPPELEVHAANADLAAGPTPGARHRAGRGTGHRRARRRIGRHSILLGGATGFVAILIAALWLTDTRPTVAVVPAVAGTTEPDATRAITAGGFAVKIEHRSDELVPAGVVLTQRPAAGTRAATHSAVSLLISAGPPTVTVEPGQWRGKPYAEVSRGLQQMGLRAERREVSGGGPPGTVTDVSPRGQVPVGDAVTVSVAAGSNVQAARPAAAIATQGTGRNAP